jgi:ATP-dependent DNA ligase
MAFDLLYVNDRSVMSLTGEQRMLMLKRCIKPKVRLVSGHTVVFIIACLNVWLAHNVST